MSAQGFFQMLVLAVALGATVVPLGRYMAKVYGTGEAAGPAPAPGDRLFLPVEKGVYRLLGVDSEREQRWNVYALSLLAFSLFSILLTYLLLSLQGLLPLNPTEMTGVGEFGAFNAAIIRGLLRRQSRTLGNFWVDLVRGTLRILLPISLVGAVALVSLGVTQNPRAAWWLTRSTER